MSKEHSKIRMAVFIFGIIIFVLLALSTFIEAGVDEDLIEFKLFRNQLQVNRFLIIEGVSHQRESQSEDLYNIVNELDLGFYVFQDSTPLSIYRVLNHDYDESVTILEDQWEAFLDFFNREYVDNSSVTRVIFFKMSNELDLIDRSLQSLEYNWKVFYLIVFSLNFMFFISLFIFVFFLSGRTEYSGGNGVMSVRNALIRGQEQERLRISLELHDKVAQDLFACRMIINDITSSTEDEGIISSFAKSITLLDSSIKEVRDLSYSLRPPALQAIGLDSAIQSYIDNFSKKIEIPITFNAVGITNKKIDETVSINLYRILQETLNNTAKHAHAEKIDVKLLYTYPYLLLKIDDNGVGFRYVKSEMKAMGRNQLGLPGIYERVSLLGGELIINTGKGEGTKILIKVPVEVNEKV